MRGAGVRVRAQQAVPRRRRKGSRARLWVSAAAILLAGWGLSCLAPAPSTPVPPPPSAKAEPSTPLPVSNVIGSVLTAPTPTIVPTLAPTPSPNREERGRAVAASLKTELDAKWLKNHRETPFRAGPSDSAASFNDLPQWTTLKQLETRGDWTLVYFEGDGSSRQPGPGWVKTADLGAIGSQPVWIAGVQGTPLWSSSSPTAKKLFDLPTGVRMEVAGRDAIVGTRIAVRIPGDGRKVPPAEGWVDTADAGKVRTPASFQVPWAFPAVINADVRLSVPYRTQLDGSPYASANCGPTSLGMALETFGINAPLKEIRERVLVAQDMHPDDEDSGSFVWALARAANQYGLKTFGLYEPDGSTLRKWSIEDIRGEVKRGHPVILQVRYRFLPRRDDSDYYGDHYVVVTGLMGDSFLYSDPIWGDSDNEGPGYDRVMSASELQRAMNASDRPYAYTGFALSR